MTRPAEVYRPVVEISASGIYYRWSRSLASGIELYGAIGNINFDTTLDRQQHYIFPVIQGDLPHGVEYNLGPGFGLTRGSDRVIMKLNLSIERFVCALFGPSSDSERDAGDMQFLLRRSRGTS